MLPSPCGIVHYFGCQIGYGTHSMANAFLYYILCLVLTLWCIVVYYGANGGAIVDKRLSDTAVAENPKTRQSVTFTKRQHDALSDIAARNNVSVCWVVRHACDLLIQKQKQDKHLLHIEDVDTDD